MGHPKLKLLANIDAQICQYQDHHSQLKRI